MEKHFKRKLVMQSFPDTNESGPEITPSCKCILKIFIYSSFGFYILLLFNYP